MTGFKINNLSKKSEIFLLSIFSIIFLVVSVNIPIQLIPIAGHDDGLFLKLGLSIYNGQWLGEYNNLTFIKGPVFPLFLAINKFLGFSYQLVVAIFSLSTFIYLVKTLKKKGVNSYLLVAIFILLIFHPSIYPHRVLRDNIYMGQVILIICFFYNLFDESNKLQVKSSLFAGFLLWCFWYTREEGLWIFPVLLTVIFISSSLNRISILLKLKSILIIGSVFLLISFLVSLINYSHYGFFGINETKDSWYSKTYKIIQTVHEDSEIPLIPVSAKKRDALYKVSPSFNKLNNYLEGDGRGWINAGCSAYGGVYCSDYAGGWFMWALRDAVASAGFYKSHDMSESFYRDVYSEVKNACENKLIKCDSGYTRIPIIGGDLNIDRLKISTYNYLKTIGLINSNFNFSYSFGPSALVEIYSKFLNRSITTKTLNDVALNFHLNLNVNVQNIELECGKNRSIVEENKVFIRLEYLFVNECLLVVNNKNIFYINDLMNGKKYPEITNLVFNKDGPVEDNFILNFYLKLFNMYSFFLLPLLVVSFFATLFLFFYRRLCNGDVLKIVAIFWIAFIARSALLIVIDMSSFPAFSENYLTPIFPIEILLITLPFYLLLTIKKGLYK